MRKCNFNIISRDSFACLVHSKRRYTNSTCFCYIFTRNTASKITKAVCNFIRCQQNITPSLRLRFVTAFIR